MELKMQSRQGRNESLVVALFGLPHFKFSEHYQKGMVYVDIRIIMNTKNGPDFRDRQEKIILLRDLSPYQQKRISKHAFSLAKTEAEKRKFVIKKEKHPKEFFNGLPLIETANLTHACFSYTK